MCNKRPLPGKISTKAPKSASRTYLAKVGLAQFRLGQEVLDHLESLVGRSLVAGGDVDLSIVFNIDLHAGLLDDATNYLAARPDELADLSAG